MRRTPGATNPPLLAALLTLFAVGCHATLARPTRLSSDSVSDLREGWVSDGAGLVRIMATEFDRCEDDIESVTADYHRTASVEDTMHVLAAAFGGSGSAGTLAAVFEAAGSDTTANQVLGVAGAIIASVGPIVTSIVAGDQDAEEHLASYERMSRAHTIALERLRLVLVCGNRVFDDPEFESTDEFRQECGHLEDEIEPPTDEREAEASAASETSRSRTERARLARAAVNSPHQLAAIASYLARWCRPIDRGSE
jgi:hypothetical protein